MKTVNGIELTGNLKKQKRGSIYTQYSLGGRKGTDFYVRAGKVTQMLVRSY